MATSSAKATPVKWFEKEAFSFKTTSELSAQLVAFINKLPEDQRPATIKDCFLILLSKAESAVSTAEMEEKLTEERSRWNLEKAGLEQQIEEFKEEINRFNEATEGLIKATDSLKQENEGLKQENERLTEAQTKSPQWFASLQALAPEMVRENDTGPDESIKRFQFVISELTEDVNRLKNNLDDTENRLQAALKRPVDLAHGEAIIRFNQQQLENIRLIRQIMESLGKRFNSKEPNEVIHAAMSEFIEIMNQITAMTKGFQPVIQLLQE